jgi:PGAP1-like protein
VRAAELRAIGDLGGDAAAGIAELARGVHEAVADRVFGALGPPAAPVRAWHDTIAATSYRGARVLAGSVVRGGAVAGGLAVDDDAPSVSETGRGRALVAALNGAWGDRLAARGSPLALSMTVRAQGRDVGTDRASLASVFVDASPRVAVFVHGLGESDDAWRRRGIGNCTPYGERLAAEHGFTPVYVRYNSGLHISANGRTLAALLDKLTASWPCEVSELALVGHSMGGLVLRSACQYGSDAGHRWPERVRSVFALGAPHMGAPLERAANMAGYGLSLVPEARPFARPLAVRAAGVKDLRHGYLIDSDWDGRDPDALRSPAAAEVPWSEHADHYFVSATLSANPDGVSGRLLGDLLVLRRSAWAQRGRVGRGSGAQRLRFELDHYRNLGEANHFDLLNHPAVYEQLSRWLSGRSARGRARAALAAPCEAAATDRL